MDHSSRPIRADPQSRFGSAEELPRRARGEFAKAQPARLPRGDFSRLKSREARGNKDRTGFFETLRLFNFQREFKIELRGVLGLAIRCAARGWGFELEIFAVLCCRISTFQEPAKCGDE